MPDTSPDTVLHRINVYLASNGFALTDTHRAELTARVLGHQDAFAQQRYEKLAAVFLLLELHFDDIQADRHVTLKRTLEYMPLQEFSDRDEALLGALRLARIQKRPIVVLNGAFELQALEEEPSDGTTYSFYRTVGKVINCKPTMDNGDIAEDTDCVGVNIKRKKAAVAAAKHYVAGLPKGEPYSLVYVCNEDTGEIIWLSEV